MKKSKFRNKRFKSEEEFQVWLASELFKTIILQDKGQDMQNVDIHKSGEILNCDFQAGIYNGKFVNLAKLAVGEPLQIWNNVNGDGKWDVMGNLVIEELR